jgi:hypothetical protein
LIFPELKGSNLKGTVLNEKQLMFLKLSEQQKRDIEIVKDAEECEVD